MARLYFQLEQPASISGATQMIPGNYYIDGMDGFTCANDVFTVAIDKKHMDKIGTMWLQYNNKMVIDLKDSKVVEDDDRLSEFAQAKLTATKWGEDKRMVGFPFGSARYLNGGLS